MAEIQMGEQAGAGREPTLSNTNIAQRCAAQKFLR